MELLCFPIIYIIDERYNFVVLETQLVDLKFASEQCYKSKSDLTYQIALAATWPPYGITVRILGRNHSSCFVTGIPVLAQS